MLIEEKTLRKLRPTRKNLKTLGVKWPPKAGWAKRLIGLTISDIKFEKLSFMGSPKKSLNPMSVDKDWAWKPESDDIPGLKFNPGKNNKNRGRNKKKRAFTARKNDGFYTSKLWRELRVRALERHECKCVMCGRSPKDHNVIIHVDHIKPRSKYPDLALEFNNLQLLCEDCNLGKSNKYETDWRPVTSESDKELDSEHLVSVSVFL